MKSLKLLVVVLLLTGLAAAKHRRVYKHGTLMKMEAVNCGYDQKEGKTFAGMMLGTDAQNRHMREALCQEYVMDSARVKYRIRPRDVKHAELLPVGEIVDFRIHKDYLLVRDPENGDKERPFEVISMEPRADVATPAAQPIGTQHKQPLNLQAGSQ